MFKIQRHIFYGGSNFSHHVRRSAISLVDGIVESLRDDRVDRKRKLVLTVADRGAGRHMDGAQLLRIVAEERRAQLVDEPVPRRTKHARATLEQFPFREDFRRTLL